MNLPKINIISLINFILSQSSDDTALIYSILTRSVVPNSSYLADYYKVKFPQYAVEGAWDWDDIECQQTIIIPINNRVWRYMRNHLSRPSSGWESDVLYSTDTTRDEFGFPTIYDIIHELDKYRSYISRTNDHSPLLINIKYKAFHDFFNILPKVVKSGSVLSANEMKQHL
jgi:hypothetical protein